VRWRRQFSQQLDWRKVDGTEREKCEVLIKFCITNCQDSGLSMILMNQKSYKMSRHWQLLIHIRYLQKLLHVVFSMYIILKIVQGVPVELCVLLFIYVFVFLIIFVVCWSSALTRYQKKETVFFENVSTAIFMSLSNILNGEDFYSFVPWFKLKF